LVKYVVSILLYEIFHFYIQIRSVYNCFNVHQCVLVRPTEFTISFHIGISNVSLTKIQDSQFRSE